MNYKAKAVFWRFMRVGVAAGVVAVVQTALKDTASIITNPVFVPIVTAALVALDKWIREELRR